MASGNLTLAARRLLSASAVRDRANRMLNNIVAGMSQHFAVDLVRLDSVCDYVVRVIRSSYADLSVPPHACWRHFEAGEIDRWGMLVALRQWPSPQALGAAAVDLAFISVLMRGLAGPGWAYAEAATGETFARSDGEAIAGLLMFAGGAFSSSPYDPLRVDARALAGLTPAELADGLQVSRSNQITGLEQRAALINRFGQMMSEFPALFAVDDGLRPGGLIAYLAQAADPDGIEAPWLLELLLGPLTAVMPGQFALGEVALGDCWPHPRLIVGDATDGLVPFHQTAQWLAYSLIEPLVWAGFDLVDLDGLTAPADPWNGSLLLDMGLLRLRDPAAAAVAHQYGDEIVVEWRALTIALVDRIADGVRRRLGRQLDTFPLACVLEGGTAAAGRRLARDKRRDGRPALIVASDPTIL
ncbi:MAG: DUF1688 family protein [Ancalomicrobiaceae bacterium]|nr:DUF1688 family protein [Ancalomicrobiaceae bacterium]